MLKPPLIHDSAFKDLNSLANIIVDVGKVIIQSAATNSKLGKIISRGTTGARKPLAIRIHRIFPLNIGAINNVAKLIKP